MTAPWITSYSSSLSNTPDNLSTTSMSSPNETCDDSFKFRAYTITYFLAFPVGFISNLLALFVFFVLTPKKSANTVFTTNLALSDVGFSLTLPFRLVYYLRGGQWDFPDWLCRWCVFSFYVNLYTSVLFLTGLSVLRYVAVLHPMHTKTVVTVRRASWTCLGIWLFVAGSSTPFLISGTFQRQGKTRCFEPSGVKSWKRILAMNYVALTFGFLIPFLIILVCYSCIIRRLDVSGRRLRRHAAARQRTIRVMAVILATFLVCFLPYHVARSVHLHAVLALPPDHVQHCQLTEVPQKILVVTLCLAASNSCFNPLLYYFSGETFRKNIQNSARLRSFTSVNSFIQGSTLQSRTRSNSSVKACPNKDMCPNRDNSTPCMLLEDNNVILNRAEDL